MNRAELSAVLEIFSFFLVTIELYGKDRLSKTHLRLIALSDKITKGVTTLREFDISKRNKRILFTCLYVVSGIIATAKLYIDYNYTEGWVDNYFAVIFQLLITFFFYLLLSSLSVFFSLLILVLFILLMTWLISNGLRLFSRMLVIVNFEGLLIFIGSLLFVISKYLDTYI